VLAALDFDTGTAPWDREFDALAQFAAVLKRSTESADCSGGAQRDSVRGYIAYPLSKKPARQRSQRLSSA